MSMTAARHAGPEMDEDAFADLDLDLDDLAALENLDEAELQALLDEDDGDGALAAPAAIAPVAPPAPPVLASVDAAPEEDDPFAGLAAPVAERAVAAPVEPAEPALDEAALGLTLATVPRIEVHAFCRTERLSRLIETAGADRRLHKAHLTIQNGDAFRAAQVFAYEPTPNLIILEADGAPGEILEGLAALAEVCDASTRVVVIGEINDISLYRALIERGVSDYVIAPRSPLQVVSAISSLYADREAAPIGRTFAFVGARGGVGSSTICHAVAWAMAEQCRSDTVLVDLDLAFGTASLDFERDPSQGLAEALGSPERLDDVLLDRLLQSCTDRLSLFAAPNLLDRDYEVAAENYEAVIDMVRGAAPSVALDLPHLWTPWTTKQLQTADEVIVTATPDLAAFRNAKNIFETLENTRGTDGQPILVLNQTGVKGRPEVGEAQFAEALGVEPKLVIPFDPVGFGAAATNGQPIQEAAPKAKASAGLTALAGQLLGRTPGDKAKASGVKGLLGLFR